PYSSGENSAYTGEDSDSQYETDSNPANPHGRAGQRENRTTGFTKKFSRTQPRFKVSYHVPRDHRSVLGLGNVVHAAMPRFSSVSSSPVITGRVHLGLAFSPAFCTKLTGAMRGSSHRRKQGLAMKAHDHLLGSSDS